MRCWNRRAFNAVVLGSLIIPVFGAARHGPDHRSLHNGWKQSATAFPFLRQVRDYAVEVLFGRSPAKSTSQRSESREALMAQYLDDVVLRFNLTTAEEEKEFSNAASRLFLDVWAFTPDFVDVRIARERIPSLLSLLPAPLRSSYSTLILNLAEAVDATYPSSRVNEKPTLRRGGPVNLAATSGEDEFGFFGDYQPLRV